MLLQSEEKECEQSWEKTDTANLADEPSASPPRFRESEWNDNKLRVWCRLPNREWELGQIQSTSGEKSTVLLLDGTAVKVSTGELLPANPDVLEENNEATDERQSGSDVGYTFNSGDGITNASIQEDLQNESAIDDMSVAPNRNPGTPPPPEDDCRLQIGS
ncbi:Myosin-2 [Camellia lanceoleosa]|uniref:Myosin-2 n=1 Tax=Camellia lanceoleosa TaxID=1840588 RepID=A0ACC0GYF8_9ERIC|nr:Myosin-2 [Camellia lanceoleosa]